MKSAGPIRWRTLLSQYPARRLQQMAAALGLSASKTLSLSMLIDRLVQAHESGKALLACFETLDSDCRLALRLAAESNGDEGIAGEVLGDELQAKGVAEPDRIVSKLLINGMLLLDAHSINRWEPVEHAFVAGGYGDFRLLLHPLLRQRVAEIPIPQEKTEWTALAAPAAVVRNVTLGQASAVISRLLHVTHIVKRCARPFTALGDPSAALQDVLLQSPIPSAAGSILLPGWFRLGELLGLLQHDPAKRSWRLSPVAFRLQTEPLRVLTCLPSALCNFVATAQVAMNYLSPQSRKDIRPFFALEDEWRAKVFATCMDLLRQASERFLDRQAWFADQELFPFFHRLSRQWKRNQSGAVDWYWHDRSVSVLKAMQGGVTLFLQLCHEIGMFDQASHEGRTMARLTAVGQLLLARWPAGDSETADLRPGLTGALQWQMPDRLYCQQVADAELVGLALGCLGEAETSAGQGAGFRITDRAISQTLTAGASAVDIGLRLEQLAAPQRPPQTLLQKVLALDSHQVRTRVCDDIAVVRAAELTAAERLQIERLGGRFYQDAIALPASQLNALAAALGITNWQVFNYDDPPEPSCYIDDQQRLQLPAAEQRDLRLVCALQEWGLDAPTERAVQLSAKHWLGQAAEPPLALERRLNSALRRLFAHLPDPPSAGLCLRLKTELELVDAPDVADVFLLRFAPEVGDGLREQGKLPEQVEYLGQGRFIVAKPWLAEVEERLSDLNIPFPAEFSAARNRIRQQTSVERLQKAVDSIFAPSEPKGAAP